MKVIHTLTAASLVLACLGAQSHGDETHPMKTHRYDPSQVEERAFGREGDPRKVSRTVRLEMSDAMRFTPSEVVVQRGQTVKFIVTNRGRQLHEMVLGTPQELKEHAELMKKFPTMEHADANMAHVKPGASGGIVWQFTQAGEYQFACLIPGHFEAGMVGKVVVQ
ncbi:cupredoxin domain-containing protein [Ideonella alba]|uniref:Cupredoxin family protein n=1 Tax=Ideonella alba TaxID=2824118 RepID=A0A940YB93_9BURK|nr:cupredoxin family protein [Ideonella alba]MBQ0932368.1 cupredoxin family protein [Ideonella alba]